MLVPQAKVVSATRPHDHFNKTKGFQIQFPACHHVKASTNPHAVWRVPSKYRPSRSANTIQYNMPRLLVIVHPKLKHSRSTRPQAVQGSCSVAGLWTTQRHTAKAPPPCTLSLAKGPLANIQQGHTSMQPTQHHHGLSLTPCQASRRNLARAGTSADELHADR